VSSQQGQRTQKHTSPDHAVTHLSEHVVHQAPGHELQNRPMRVKLSTPQSFTSESCLVKRRRIRTTPLPGGNGSRGVFRWHPRAPQYQEYTRPDERDDKRSTSSRQWSSTCPDSTAGTQFLFDWCHLVLARRELSVVPLQVQMRSMHLQTRVLDQRSLCTLCGTGGLLKAANTSRS